MPDHKILIRTGASHWQRALYLPLLLIYILTGWMFDANWRTGLIASANSTDAPLRILFIGNSFTYYNDMPAIFEGLAKARQPNKKIQVSFSAEGGYALWHHAADENTKNALMRGGPWDYIVLQEQSAMPLKESSVKVMDQWCVWFDRWIRSYHARPVLFMTWCDVDKPEDQVAISKVYRDLGLKLNAMVIPAGELMLEVTQKEPDITLYDADGHHPGPNGSYLVACLFCNMLLHTQSESVGNIPDYAVETLTTASVDIKEPVAKKLQKYAADFAALELKRQHLN